MNNLTIYNTGKVDLIAVLLPEGAYNISVSYLTPNKYLMFDVRNYGRYVPERDKFNRQTINLPPGNWKLIGSPFDVTEEEARELVDSWLDVGYQCYGEYEDLAYVRTAIESWYSLLSHLQIYRENPFKRPNEGEPDEDVFWEKSSQYQRGEARVGNWVFMIKSK